MKRKSVALSLRLLSISCVASACWFAPAALADVTGEGDVKPHILVDISGVMTPVPDLPIDGGVLTAPLIVGGTDIAEKFTTVGIVVVDTPAFTDPLQAPSVFIGNSAEGIGQVTISGRFSELRVDTQLVVGLEGLAWLDITGGAVVTTDFVAPGTGDDSIVGQEGGSQGFVTVAGFGSKWEHSQLTVGLQGYGEVRVSDRGFLETLEDGAIIGSEVNLGGDNDGLGTGYVEVVGQGSRWHVVEDDLIVADEGRGELQVRSGGLVRVLDGALIVGNAAGTNVNSRGVVVVSDASSELWVNDSLTIGSSSNTGAQAELFVRDGGRVRADGGITVGFNDFVNLSGETAQSTILASTMTNAGTLRGSGRVEVGAVINPGDIRNAASVANTRERLVFTGTVNNTGNIESVGGEIDFQQQLTHTGGDADLVGIDAIFRFSGGITTSGGASVFLEDTLIYITPGSSFASGGSLSLWEGESTLIGDLELQATNVLNVTLGDPYSRMQVIGDATVAGEVDVFLADDYLPQIGDAFEIIDAEAMSGMFDFITGGGGGPGFWEASYTTTSAILTYVADIVSPLLADFDGNGIVDAGDMDVWRMNFGDMMATMAEGDANGDGVVDGADLIIIQREFGMSFPATPAAGAVPEPSALGLAGMSVALLSLFRRKRS